MTTEAKVGAFTVIGVILFAAVAALLSGVSLSGHKGYTLYAGFKQVIGVEPDSVVRLSGVPVGKVKSIRNDGGGVTVSMEITGNTKILKGSQVTIGSSGVMGDKFVNILPGKDQGIYLGDGDYLIGQEEEGIDSLFAKAGDVMDQVQTLLDSMNQVMGNPDFQKNFLQMAVNIRDMTAHMDGLVAAMEQTMRDNQGNINQMLTNLNAASGGLNRTMQQVEAMMTNLATVGADPQTAENLRLTLANIKDASDRIANMAENMNNAVGDPQTAEDLKATIHNARQMSEKAGNMMGKLEDIKVSPSADVLYSGAKDDWQTNFNVDIGPEKGNFLRAGLDDIGDGNRGNFEIGRRSDRFAVRGGVINGDVGVGLDAYAGKRFVFSADAMDPNDLSLRLRAQYELNNAGTWLMGQWNDVNDSDKRAAYLGIRQSF